MNFIFATQNPDWTNWPTSDITSFDITDCMSMVGASADLCYNKNAQASSTYGSYLPTNVCNESNDDYWLTASSYPQYIVIDLNSINRISSVQIRFMNICRGEIYTSLDNANWTKVKDFSNASSGQYTYAFTAQLARYIKVLVTYTTAFQGRFALYNVKAYLDQYDVWSCVYTNPSDYTFENKDVNATSAQNSLYLSIRAMVDSSYLIYLTSIVNAGVSPIYTDLSGNVSGYPTKYDFYKMINDYTTGYIVLMFKESNIIIDCADNTCAYVIMIYKGGVSNLATIDITEVDNWVPTTINTSSPYFLGIRGNMYAIIDYDDILIQSLATDLIDDLIEA